MTSNPNTSPLRSENSVNERFRRIAKNKEMQESESGSVFLGRNVAQLGSRALETILGLPGNIKKQFQKELTSLYDFFSATPESRINATDSGINEPEEGSFHELFMNPPGSADIREQVTPLVSEKLFGDKEYLEPKSPGEKFAGELTQDITSFFLPGSGQRLAIRLGAPIVGNLAKQGAKYFGVGEENSEKIKLGVMLATSLAGQANPSQFASQRIGQAKQMIPAHATADVSNLPARLRPLIVRLQRGLNVPSKSRANQGIQDLFGQIRNNRMSLHGLMDARDNINEWISEAGGWDIPAPTRDATVRNLNELKRSIIDTIDENLHNRFPQAADLYRTGYEAAAVTHRSNAISRFIERHFGKKTASMGAKLLFPAVAGGAAVLPKTAAVGAGLFPLYKSGQVLYRVANSPTLAAYYQDVIRNALAQNAPAMVKSMEKLDKELEKEEKKQGKINPEALEEFKNKFKNRG